MASVRSGVLAIALAIFSPCTFLQAQAPPRTSSNPALAIDLQGALERARINSPQLQSASLAVELAREDRYLAKAAFRPTLNGFNQYIYTQGNGTPSGVFVANDGVHVYSSQAVVHQDVYSPARLAEYRQAAAAEALAAARRDVAVRGLVSTVVQNYYTVVTAQRHQANAQQALEEARRFVDLTAKLESGGEVAHSDFVKAQLTLEQRRRDLQDAQLSIDKGKIGLAVLLFPDYRTDFSVVDDLAGPVNLPPLEQLQALVGETSPDLRAAEATLRQEEFGVAVARSAYFPTFSMDYFFGINSNQFAVKDEEGHNRLGSVAQGTLNIPVFNWSITRSRVRQASLRREQAQLDLVLTRRQLTSNLRSSYAEAQSALAQLDSLKRSLDLAAESLNLTNLRYQAGEATVLEVVDAQTTLSQARNAYDDGLSRYRLAVSNVQVLTGTY